MVARLSELSAPWAVDPALAPGATHNIAGHIAPRLAVRGQLLLERASSLAGVRPGGRGIPGISGVPLQLDGAVCRNRADTFLRDRVFAVIGNDGSLCLRLPQDIADDLIENGLCIRAGKNLLTWPLENEQQLEVAWRILLHAYWHVTDTPERHARRLWSEWVVNH